MRIHVLGQQIPASLAVLAGAEGAIAWFSMFAAVCIRFSTSPANLKTLEADIGPVLPRAAMYAAIVLVCLLAFGLYSARQRAQLSGVLVRVAAALVIASAVLAAVFYLVPSLQPVARRRGARGHASTGCGVVISRHRVRARGRPGHLQAPRARLWRRHGGRGRRALRRSLRPARLRAGRLRAAGRRGAERARASASSIRPRRPARAVRAARCQRGRGGDG